MAFKSNKSKAESQFNFSAPPKSLKSFIEESTTDFKFDFSDLDDEYDTNSSLGLNEIVILPEYDEDLDPMKLILLANDVDPQLRDSECKKSTSVNQQPQPVINNAPLSTQLDPFNSIQESKSIKVYDGNELTLESKIPHKYDVNKVNFQIEHRKFKNEVQGLKYVNRPTQAMRILSLAFNKMSDEDFKYFEIDKPKFICTDNNPMLIDKSEKSVKFVNRIANIMVNQMIRDFNKFKHKPSANLETDKIYLENFFPTTRLENVFAAAIIAKHIKFHHIDLNSSPIYDLLSEHNVRLSWTTHQILAGLGFYTINANLYGNFDNIRKFVSNFPSKTGSKRLHYLEYLLRQWKQGHLFFESKKNSFLEKFGEPWNNQNVLSSVRIIRRKWPEVFDDFSDYVCEEQICEF
jgi:hypothetical protein